MMLWRITLILCLLAPAGAWAGWGQIDTAGVQREAIDERRSTGDDRRATSDELQATSDTARPSGDVLVEPVAGPEPSALSLGLRAAIRVGLAKNANPRLARLALGQSVSQVKIEQARFIPDISVTIENDRALEQASSFFAATSDERINVLNASWTQYLKSGQTVVLEYDAQRRETNSTFYKINPFYSSIFAVELTWPLMRGKGSRYPMLPVEIAEAERALAEIAVEESVSTLTLEIIRAYWNTVLARSKAAVMGESYRHLARVSELVRHQAELGLKSPLERLAIEAQLEDVSQDWLERIAAADGAQDRLKTLLRMTAVSDWDVQLELDTVPHLGDTRPDLTSALRLAFEHRPDVRGAKLQIEKERLNIALLELTGLPRVDLVTRGELNGLSNNISGMNNNLTSGNYYSANVKLEVKSPVDGQAARETMAQQRSAVESWEARIEALNDRVAYELRDSLRGMNLAHESLRAARTGVRLSQEALEFETQRYEEGLVPFVTLVEQQKNVISAKTRMLENQIAESIAHTELLHRMGTLAQAHGIETKIIQDRGQRKAKQTEGENNP